MSPSPIAPLWALGPVQNTANEPRLSPWGQEVQGLNCTQAQDQKGAPVAKDRPWKFPGRLNFLISPGTFTTVFLRQCYFILSFYVLKATLTYVLFLASSISCLTIVGIIIWPSFSYLNQPISEHRNLISSGALICCLANGQCFLSFVVQYFFLLLCIAPFSLPFFLCHILHSVEFPDSAESLCRHSFSSQSQKAQVEPNYLWILIFNPWIWLHFKAPRMTWRFFWGTQRPHTRMVLSAKKLELPVFLAIPEVVFVA